MRILYFDCFSGISGDMTVGALCDLGVSPSTFEWELSKLELGDYHLHFGREKRQHISGVKFGVHEGATHSHDAGEHEPAHEHTHEQGHGHVHGRSHREIRELIEGSELTDFVKTHALGIFHRIAVAEGKIHGQPADDVTFHEVGALDSIVDIVATCIGLEQLGVEKIHVSALAEGRGWTQSAHGHFPIPAPATVEILQGFRLQIGDGEQELITPTGAAIVAEFATAGEVLPPFVTAKIGYGLGFRNLADRPNVLRAVLGETSAEPSGDRVTLLATNLDDLSPELAGATLSGLLESGALDAWFTAVQMKKNRPGFELSVLCPISETHKFADLILRETSAFGVRKMEIDRITLERHFEKVATPFGEIRIKIGSRAGEVWQRSPEFESCRLAAEKAGVPVREVMLAALAALPGATPDAPRSIGF